MIRDGCIKSKRLNGRQKAVVQITGCDPLLWNRVVSAEIFDYLLPMCVELLAEKGVIVRIALRSGFRNKPVCKNFLFMQIWGIFRFWVFVQVC